SAPVAAPSPLGEGAGTGVDLQPAGGLPNSSEADQQEADMFIKRKRGWELPESAATPESVWRQRRELVKAIAAGPILLGTGSLLTRRARAAETDPTADLYPAPRNGTYMLDRDVTPEELATTYNNFYEFNSSKDVVEDAAALKTRPWTVVFDGMVEEEKTVDIDTLIRAMPLEERLYRHRCV